MEKESWRIVYLWSDFHCVQEMEQVPQQLMVPYTELTTELNLSEISH